MPSLQEAHGTFVSIPEANGRAWPLHSGLILSSQREAGVRWGRGKGRLVADSQVDYLKILGSLRPNQDCGH